MLGMVLRPWDTIPHSPQLRWVSFLISYLFFLALVSYGVTRDTSIADYAQFKNTVDTLLQIFVYSKAGADVQAFVEQIGMVARDNPELKQASVLLIATKQFFVLDPWIFLDIFITMAMVVAYAFRYLHRADEFNVLVAVMVIPAAVRCLRVLDLHPSLGPLLQSVGKQVKDVMVFLSIFGTVLIAFSVTFTVLADEAPSGRYVTFSQRLVHLLVVSC